MFRNDRCPERPNDYNNETSYNYVNMDKNMMYPEAAPMLMGGNVMSMGCTMPPIYECPQERVCHREFVHEVPQV